MKGQARRAVRDDAAARRKPLAFVGATRAEAGARVANGRVLNPQRDPATTPREAEDATREAVEARRTHLEDAPAARGLRNLGNTCFLNATLQALRSVPGVAQTLGDSRWPLADRGADVAAAFRAALNPRETAPRNLVKRLRRINRGFRLGRQEDAHELLRALLDASSSGFAKLHREDKRGPVEALFEGRSTSTLTCPECGYASKTTDPFLDLSLEPLESVNQALKAWSAPETLSSSDAWRCGGCDKRVRATKALGVQDYPEALVVHLKRFRAAQLQRRRRRQPQKIERRVAFDTRWSPADTASYDLTGVVIHHGSTTRGGHYTAYARSQNKWWHYDDSRVTPCKESEVLRSKAYLLFYARNSQKRARIDSVDLPSRRKRPRPSLVTVDSAPLLEAKFRLMAAFERRFKRVVVKHGAAGLRRKAVKRMGARGKALKAKSEANQLRRRQRVEALRPRRSATRSSSRREASAKYLGVAKDVLSEEQYAAFVELARTIVQGCTESEEFACIEKVEKLFEGHGLLKHHFNLILPGSFDVPEQKRTELHGVEDYARRRREGTLPAGVVAQPEASRQLGGLFDAAADSDSDDESFDPDASSSSEEEDADLAANVARLRAENARLRAATEAAQMARAVAASLESAAAAPAASASSSSSSSSSSGDDEDFEARMDQQLEAERAKVKPAFEVAAARRALDTEAPVTAWGGFAVGGWGDDDTDVRAAPPPKKRPKHRYDAWDRSLDAPRRGNWDD